MDYLVPDEAAAGPFGQALVASDCIHWGPSVTQGPCQVLCLHSLGRGRKTEHQAPSPTVRRWWSWDLNPGQHQLFSCGGGGGMSSGVPLGLASLGDLPTPREVLALEAPSQSKVCGVCCRTVLYMNICPFTDG